MGLKEVNKKLQAQGDFQGAELARLNDTLTKMYARLEYCMGKLEEKELGKSGATPPVGKVTTAVSEIEGPDTLTILKDFAPPGSQVPKVNFKKTKRSASKKATDSVKTKVQTPFIVPTQTQPTQAELPQFGWVLNKSSKQKQRHRLLLHRSKPTFWMAIGMSTNCSLHNWTRLQLG